MKAVIVAAGRGKRLMPFTSNCPKPLLQVRG
ncbi:MAG: sugar phosphate nucleotidyltransferase, partial [Armatimonadota bacterium]